ncbi:MAG: DUF3822 family protein [Thermoanaerobaculia bacterium]|nr:DUF3822 family protein [Thermoanaerobaculia bacterium]
MDTNTLDYTDDRLTASAAPQCILQVVLGADSISLLSADHNGAVLALQSWTFPSGEQAFHQSEWQLRGVLRQAVFGLPFGHIHCALFHRNATLVPRRLFQHGNLATYFKLLLNPAEYTYAYDELPEFDAYLVYATEQGLARLCTEFFPRGRVRHLAVPLLRQARDLDASEEHRIFVNIRNQVAQIAVFERQNLLFYNSFAFAASPDLLYYILLVYDQFRLNPQDTPLIVAGNLLEDSELYRLLYRFVRDIRFAALPGYYRLPEDAGILPGHCYFDLFCLKNL